MIDKDYLERLDAAVMRVVTENSIAVEHLTEAQLASAIKQAISCGDFVRQVMVTDDAQRVVYTPFKDAVNLRAEILQLRGLLLQHGIPIPERLEDQT